MKKIMQLSLAVLCAAFVFTSCGSEIDADIAKFKGYMCKGVELSEKAKAGDADAVAEMQTMGTEVEAFIAELEKKYPDGSEEQKKFEEEMGKIMADPTTACK